MKEKGWIVKIGEDYLCWSFVEEALMLRSHHTAIWSHGNKEEAEETAASCGGTLLRIEISTPEEPGNYQEWLAQTINIVQDIHEGEFDDLKYNWQTAFESGWEPEEAAQAAVNLVER